MDPVNWFAFVVASAVLLLIPGPTVLLVVSYALTQGRKVAVAMATGVALGDFVAMTLSLAGLGALLATSATLFTILKWIGAAYLVYLGVRLWRSKPFVSDPASQAEPRPSRGVFGHAFVVTALNPKGIAFFVAFVPQFIDSTQPILPQLIILEATFVGLAAANAFLFALAADQVRVRLRRPAMLTWMNRVGAGCLVGMGAATAALNRS
ncbi:LysE family translocator [Bauldia sp.]|uniref:LysE family translocator n=1 Tax=Bauldia sp. TaxID=2575872 RepID=UPI003BAC39E4